MMRMNIKGTTIIRRGTHSKGALNILVEEGTILHPNGTEKTTQITLWPMKHWRKFQFQPNQ